MESASSLPAHETMLAKKSVSSRMEKVEGCNLPPPSGFCDFAAYGSFPVSWFDASCCKVTTCVFYLQIFLHFFVARQ